MLVGAAFGGVHLAESTSQFLGQAAAVNATMDPQLQALTRTHPELTPILEDVAGLVPDAGQLLAALRALVIPLQLLKAEARVTQFAAAARRALPSAAATRVVEGAIVRELRTPSALNRIISALPDRRRFRPDDLQQMEHMMLQLFDAHPVLVSITPNMHRVEQPGWGRLLSLLRQDDRIRPLTRQALIEHDPLLSPAELSHFLEPRYVGWPIHGHIFVREGMAHDCMRTIMHEATHVNQHLATAASQAPRARFTRELQAFAVGVSEERWN